MTPLLPARARDVPALARLVRDSFDPRYGEAWNQASLEAVFEMGHVFALAADGPAGFTGMALVRVVADEAELLLMCVAVHARRTGLGAALVDGAAREAARRGAAAMFLEVRASNSAARALYNAHGFTEIGRRRHYYLGTDGNNHDAITMRRSIATE
jgi:ribosomal-protein-alanine N-acetyltransferase